MQIGIRRICLTINNITYFIVPFLEIMELITIGTAPPKNITIVIIPYFNPPVDLFIIVKISINVPNENKIMISISP